jgi:trans-aconitate methyltransferase
MDETAWFDKNILPTAMLNSGFKPLRQSDHFATLDKSLSMTTGDRLLDLGCGIAEVAGTFPLYDYTGVDLPHIIENAARVKTPEADFISFDANIGSYDFIENYDIVLMNSFISEIPDWYRCLSNVLYHSKSYVIIHRQEVTNLQSHLRGYRTYAGLQTTNSVINYDELRKLFYFNEFEVVYESNSFPNDKNQKTFVLKKESNNVT